MPALRHVLDVAVVGRRHERDARGLRVAHERREEPVVRAQHRAGARVVHRMARDVGLEELVQREVVLPREREEVLRRALRRDDGDVGVPVLDRLAREVLHERAVLHEVVGRQDDLGRRQGHDRRHRLEAAGLQLLGGVHEVGVGERDLLPALLELQEEVVLLDDLPQRRTREALAVLAHRHRAVHAREHGGLAGRGLRQPLDLQARVDRLRVAVDEAAKRRANLVVDGVIRGLGPHADAIYE